MIMLTPSIYLSEQDITAVTLDILPGHRDCYVRVFLRDRAEPFILVERDKPNFVRQEFNRILDELKH